MPVRFTETMNGFYGPGAPGYDTGEMIGRRDGIRLNFMLTMSARNVRDLIADPRHPMRADGTIVCKEFAAAPIPVYDGQFQVFAPAQRGRYTMRYRLPFKTGSTSMTLLGHKDVGDDWGPDLWPDTTTLYIRLVQGRVDWFDDGIADGEHARGILKLTAPMFARELSTFRGSPAGVGAYGLFFLTHLLSAYTGTKDKGRLK